MFRSVFSVIAFALLSGLLIKTLASNVSPSICDWGKNVELNSLRDIWELLTRKSVGPNVKFGLL